MIAGISGAGKSTALHALTDLGYYVIDNLPVPLFSTFIQFSERAPEKYKRTVLLLDVFSRDTQRELQRLLGSLEGSSTDTGAAGLDGGEASRLSLPANVQLIFLDCRTETVLKRYSETRRPHPGFDVGRDLSLADTIERERNRLMELKERATFRIDTSDMNVHELRRVLKSFVDGLEQSPAKLMRINFLSFGYKYGLPLDCDLVVDVRFLPNPYFVQELREQSGLDPGVGEYVMSQSDAREFVARYAEILNFLLPRYLFEGKSYLNIGVGCTGGRHRSVVIAEMLSKEIRATECLVSVKHRDVGR